MPDSGHNVADEVGFRDGRFVDLDFHRGRISLRMWWAYKQNTTNFSIVILLKTFKFFGPIVGASILFFKELCEVAHLPADFLFFEFF